jgi:hypothetical protein
VFVHRKMLVRIRHTVALLALCMLPSACRSQEVENDARWTCHVDADCMNSCALGAVNRGWYATHGKAFVECQDGCDNQVTAPPSCLEGVCVAFQHNPSKPSEVRRNDFCTRKAMPKAD